MSLPITEHFTLAEFACRDGTPYPPAWIAERLVPLCQTLERIRAEFGAPCIVMSGYRSSAHNALLRKYSKGVAQNSEHTRGRAADVRFKGVPPARVHETILRLYRTGELLQLGGLGLYPRWVHVDVRPRAYGHLAQWTGAGFGSEPVA